MFDLELRVSTHLFLTVVQTELFVDVLIPFFPISRAVFQQCIVEAENFPGGGHIVNGMFDFLVTVVVHSVNVAAQKRLEFTAMQFCLEVLVIDLTFEYFNVK